MGRRAAPLLEMPSARGNTRWRVIAAGRWRMWDVLKLSVIAVVVLVFGWNVSMLSAIVHRPVSSMETPSILRLHEATEETKTTTPPTTAPLLRVEEEKVASVVSTAAVTPNVKKPWFLEPDWYKLETGCDFSEAVRIFDPSQLEINCDNVGQLELGEFLGQGFWRQVFKTKWNGREVAVKVVKAKLMDRGDIIPRHVEEAAAIFGIRHEPNIVSLVGWCNTTVVVEYVPTKLDELVFDPDLEVTVHRALELARDAAHGLAQLHQAPGGPFAHTDIQTRQFLVDDHGRLKLNDFNRVKYTGSCLLPGQSNMKCYSKTSVAKGKWRSPEEYLKLDIDEKADIYSLSLVLWSLRSRVKPFDNLDRETVYDQVPKGMRPDVKAMEDFPQEMQDLIVRSWHHDPEKRPSSLEMAKEIDRILQNYVAAQS
ncbi:hypothetical protein Poli38472_009593 [Pythium oligandrum]|uniref:Protein kinase domain-containing protein n=1 Tax=Pythium oligandrum TaxID=41045 RepID=A0A8K1FFV9_PYTOL|nr:hypothetical protein Poli38472_009593 [Pythium oligandrum]|eukprot:TMW62100.1 hypothetical protein Poli38472_009593 [Pythium oligandrum]